MVKQFITITLSLFLALLPRSRASTTYLRSSSPKLESSDVLRDTGLKNGPARERAAVQQQSENKVQNQGQTAANSHHRHPPIPRDLFIDKKSGMGFLKVPGTAHTNSSPSSTGHHKKMDMFAFEPYGHRGSSREDQRYLTDEQNIDGTRKLGGSKDTTKPTIANIQPLNNATLPSNTFEIRATVTDNAKVSSVSVTLTNTGTGASSTFTLSNDQSTSWAKTIQVTPGATARMTITATDSSKNAVTSPIITFKAGIGNSNSSSAETTRSPITKAQWANRDAPISKATGRLLFQMQDSTGKLLTYACSGTLVQLPSSVTTPNRSIVMTAAHCVYNDVTKTFARNVTFIPQQDDGGSDRSDRDCTNDALGCLTMDYGFVSKQYASRIFPNNVGADYGFYVSKSTVTDVKGKTIGATGDIVPMLANFGSATQGAWTYAMGYSYLDDPNFMYSLGTVGKDNSGGLVPNYSLKTCTLTEGASGGPWTQDDPTTGIVGIMGTNSWGYVGEPGMASSPTNTGGAACVYNAAVSTNLATIVAAGVVVNCNI